MSGKDSEFGKNISVEPISEKLEKVEVDLRRAVFNPKASTVYEPNPTKEEE